MPYMSASAMVDLANSRSAAYNYQEDQRAAAEAEYIQHQLDRIQNDPYYNNSLEVGGSGFGDGQYGWWDKIFGGDDKKAYELSKQEQATYDRKFAGVEGTPGAEGDWGGRYNNGETSTAFGSSARAIENYSNQAVQKGDMQRQVNSQKPADARQTYIEQVAVPVSNNNDKVSEVQRILGNPQNPQAQQQNQFMTKQQQEQVEKAEYEAAVKNDVITKFPQVFEGKFRYGQEG